MGNCSGKIALDKSINSIELLIKFYKEYDKLSTEDKKEYDKILLERLKKLES
jgi:hypothetical protein